MHLNIGIVEDMYKLILGSLNVKFVVLYVSRKPVEPALVEMFG